MIETLGVHITTWNRALFTDQCLVWSKPTNTKVIVVDNFSTDETREKVFPKFEKYRFIDFVLNDENKHLGYAVNQGWDILSKDCDFLMWINNDFLFMPGWEQNALTVINDLGLDYLISVPNSYKRSPTYITKNGGKYKTRLDMGTGFSIRTEMFKNGVRPETKPFRHGHSGPGNGFYTQLKRGGYKGARLANPSIHRRYCEYSNPELVEYYNTTFQMRGLMKKLNGYRKREVDGNPRDGLRWKEFKQIYYPKRKYKF
jgi:glycosyltransferase involved in cell wall biosynthesis